MQISYEMISNAHVHQLAVSLNNLFPRARLSFGQHQETELWIGIINFQSFRFLYLGVPVSRRLRNCVPCLTSRDKVDVDVFHRDIQYALEKHIVEVKN